VLWENKAVRPQDHHPLVLEKFKRILTWDDTLVDNKKYFKFLHPYPEHAPLRPTPPFAQKKLLLNISINKRSSYPRELYSARLNSLRYFNDHYPKDFDMFGIGWNQPATKWERMLPWLMPKFSCYRGPVKNKLDALPNYKFSLCYENIRGEQGYVSEKIFDCFRAGVVPIYWGSDNVTDYVDAAAFIDRRQFKSDKALAEFLLSITESEYAKYQAAIDNYFLSDKFRAVLSSSFAENIIRQLQIAKVN